MNKTRLRAKLNKVLLPDAAKFMYETIISSGYSDEVVDVVIKDGKFKCIVMEGTPRENLKRAIINYFDSACPTELATYTAIDNEVKKFKRDFDKLVLESISEAVSELEDL